MASFGRISATHLSFGESHVGDAGATLTFTITNAGHGAPLKGWVNLNGLPGGILGYQDDLSITGGDHQWFNLPSGHSETFTVKVSDLHAEAFADPNFDPVKTISVNYLNGFVGGMRQHADTIGISGDVLNYASPWFTRDAGAGNLYSIGQNRFVANLGDVHQGSPIGMSFAVENISRGPADAITEALAGAHPDFVLGQPVAIHVGAGDTEHGFSVAAAPGSGLGYHTDTVTMNVGGGHTYSLILTDHVVA